MVKNMNIKTGLQTPSSGGLQTHSCWGHLLLFFLSNILAGFIIYIEHELSNWPDLSNNYSLIAPFAFGVYAMVFTFIPYFIFIILIKNIKSPSLLVYTVFGTLTPIFPIILLYAISPLESIGPFLLLLLITGAICGIFYGYFDRKYISN